jgi:hypothetical protein
MRLWLKKLSVVLITFMTFGTFIPPTYLDGKASDLEVIVNETENSQIKQTTELTINKEQVDVHEQFVSYVSYQAKVQSLQKFGPKITKVVGDEFLNVILPNIEMVINNLANKANEEDLLRFEVTESPASGYGEKIFHIYDQQTNKDVARFHVSRINHPTEGYSFNFHYHLQDDKYERHYNLGEIYWDKNTPPKWTS